MTDRFSVDVVTLQIKGREEDRAFIPLSGNSPYVFKLRASSDVYLSITSALAS